MRMPPRSNTDTSITGLRRQAVFIAAVVVVLLGWRSVYAQSTIKEFESSAEGWLLSVKEPEVYSFDSFYPGLSGGKGNLTGPVVSIDLGTTTLQVEELGTVGAALRDASSFAQASDAPLYVLDGVGSRWTFSTPIYGFYTFYGSADASNTISMRLYSNGNLVDEIQRYGGGLGTYAVGHGFVSKTPIDRIDFVSVGWDNAILVGAFVGLDASETSLGARYIPGYRGPNGSTVESDFGISTLEPPDFRLSVTTLFASQIATFIVDEAQPNKRAYLTYSLQGPGSTMVPQLGVSLDLKKPKQLSGFIVTDSQGVGQWQLWMPPAAKNRTIWFQAAQPGWISNVVQRQVN